MKIRLILSITPFLLLLTSCQIELGGERTTRAQYSQRGFSLGFKKPLRKLTDARTFGLYSVFRFLSPESDSRDQGLTRNFAGGVYVEQDLNESIFVGATAGLARTDFGPKTNNPGDYDTLYDLGLYVGRKFQNFDVILRANHNSLGNTIGIGGWSPGLADRSVENVNINSIGLAFRADLPEFGK